MELQHFVAQTLIAVIEGVREAQSKALELGAVVNPVDARIGGLNGRQPVVFDVEVSTAQGSTGKQGAGIMVAPLGWGGQTGSDTRSGSVGRHQVHCIGDAASTA